MEFRDYLRMLRRGWLAVVLITLLGLGGSLLYLQLATKTYEARSLLYVSTRGTSSIEDLQAGSQFSTRAVSTYAEMASTPVILDPVIRSLRLQMTPQELAEWLTVSVRSDTTLIEITVTTADRARAAAVANAVATSMSTVITRLETTNGVAGVRAPVQLEQIQNAVVPTLPVSPDRQQVIALGLLLGLTFGLGLTILVQALDTRIRRARDFWSLTDAPLLAAIPHVSRSEGRSLVARDHPTRSSGESFRTLRTNIRFLETSERRSLVVTSAVEHETQPHIATNLAWSLADAGYRVVLIDVDLRHPQIGDDLGISGQTGLSDVLAGHVDVDEVVRSTDHEQLKVILAGTRPPNPSELVGSPGIRKLLTAMEAEFDYVILHAPSILSYTDAVVLAVAAERTVLTITAGKTRINQLSAALGALGNVGLKPLGIVMSAVRASMDPEEYFRPPERKNRLRPQPESAALPARAREHTGARR